MATKSLRQVTNNGKKTIIVGTIDPNIEEVIGQNLDLLQFNITFVRKSSKLLLAILDHDVDLMILDMDLPGPFGFEILPIIRKSRPRLPMIIISEDYTYNLRKIVAEQKINYQLIKPVDSEEIDLVTETVQSLLYRKAVA